MSDTYRELEEDFGDEHQCNDFPHALLEALDIMEEALDGREPTLQELERLEALNMEVTIPQCLDCDRLLDQPEVPMSASQEDGVCLVCAFERGKRDDEDTDHV